MNLLELGGCHTRGDGLRSQVIEEVLVNLVDLEDDRGHAGADGHGLGLPLENGRAVWHGCGGPRYIGRREYPSSRLVLRPWSLGLSPSARLDPVRPLRNLVGYLALVRCLRGAD
jgi:hypothetical protein